MSLWSEIKQRRITQVVFAYLAGGWMVLVVIDQVVDREVLPLVVYEVALTVYLVGILAALIIGWYHGELGEQKAPLREIVLLAIVAVVGLGASGLVVRNAMQESTIRDALIASGTDLRSIAVLYLDDASRDGSLQPVAEGITEGLISRLSEVQELDVRSRNASREARALGDVGADSVASVLGVGTVIDGSVSQQGGDLTVTVRILEGQTGTQIVRESYTWPADDVASVSTELAEEVAQTLREQLGVEIRMREARADAPNSAAWLQVARAERYLKEAGEALGHGDAAAAQEALEAADAELLAARESAPEWSRPLMLRSRVAYEGHVLAHSMEDMLATLDRAVELASQALELDPDNAAALDWRGTALYRRWLTRVDDGEDAQRLLQQARGDLERAARLDPTRASVNSTLSHLLIQVDDPNGAILAARRAYEQDAFLDVADGVLWRLYTSQYDLGNYDQARRWCEEGHRRFPVNFRFVQCQIVLMSMPEADPDVREAWALYEELLPLLSEQAEFFDAQARTVVAGVIGRAGLADSAQAVFESARVGPEVDPQAEVLLMEAVMRSVMGDVDAAVETLERFVVRSEGRAPGQHWWWQNLEGDPRFERLQAIH